MKKVNDVSKPRHLTLRIVAFVFFFVLAVGAFAFGVVRIGQKEDGYQSISASVDEEEPNYASGFALQYYFSGSSNAIKEEMKKVSEVYSAALKRAYKLLDKNRSYEGYNNIYTLNSQQGHPVVVSDELYVVLQDAYVKTDEGAAYSLFSGAMNDHWNAFLYADTPQEFDPSANEEEQERLETLAKETLNPKNFTLQFGEDNAVTFAVSDAYEKVMKRCEVEGNVLDTGALHDAYVLFIVANALEDAGYNKGYLTSTSGLTVALTGQKTGKMVAYDANGEIAKEMPCVPGRTFCQYRLFPLVEGELGYFSVDGHYRSPAANPMRLDEANLSAVTLAVVPQDAVYACVKLLSGGQINEETLPAMVITKDGENMQNSQMEEIP